MIMLDICAGLGGASQAMKVRGWDVITVDYDPKFNCTYTADIRTWKYNGPIPDLVWCSPPCDEFSRESMPWCKTGNEPSTELALACKRFIDQVKPRYWVIENVKGAIKYFEPLFGRYRAHIGPFYLWGHFHDFGNVPVTWRKKESFGSDKPEERAKIPAALSSAMAKAIEMQSELMEMTR